jgi:calcium permeable stress-gated cation channel
MSARPRTRILDELWWSTTTIGGTTYTYIPTGPPPTDSSSTISNTATGNPDGTISPSASSTSPSGQETWTSSSSGSLHPSGTGGQPSSVTSYGSHTSHPTSTLSASTSYTTTFTSTSAYPVTTVSRSDTTFTSYSTTVYTSSSVIYATPSAQVNANYNPPPVCIGNGLDIQSMGLLSTLIIPSVVGLIIWVRSLLSSLTPLFNQALRLLLRYFDPASGKCTEYENGLHLKGKCDLSCAFLVD